MTTSEFTKLLQNPTGLNAMSYEALDNLLLQYPYCNGIRMLLLKKYKNDKHIAFERHLALASMYAADRGKLYDFLNTSMVSNAKIVALNNKDKSKEEKKTKVTTQLISPPPVYQQRVSENPPVLVFQKPIRAEDIIDGNRNSDQRTEDEDRSLSSMPIEEWLQDFEPPRIDEKGPPSKKKGFRLSRIPIFEKGMFDFPEAATEKPAAKKTTKAKPAKRKTKSNKAKAKPLFNEEPDFPNLEEVEDAALEFENLEQMYEDNSEQDNIFGLFLSQTNGLLKSISDKKGSGDKKNVEEWEDASTIENEEIVSETLADLLAKQGQKDKATKMYESLSLKFPEKSRLFADKIAALEE